VIVLEGTDLTGKSTLAKTIHEKFGSKLLHMGLPPHGYRHWDVLKQELALVNRNTIFDRACLGSIVYGQIKNDEANAYPVTTEELIRFNEYVIQTHSLIVHAMAPTDTLRKRFRRRGDSYLTVGEIIRAAGLYQEVFGMLHPATLVVEYDSSQQTADEFVNTNFPLLYMALLPATGHVTDYKAQRILGK
jgi:deoxyadenosine/deoxycytidine kinase